MTNTYRPLSDIGHAVFGDDVFDADFTPAAERDYLDGGHLELVPRSYTVTSDNYAAGEWGDVVELALPVEIEAALISGGHLKLGDEPEDEPEDDEPEDDEPTEEEA